jgi:putative colanic acid biosynthesis acetyltransferase WcaF
MPLPARPFYRERYHNGFSWRNQLSRLAWEVVWAIAFRPSPTPLFAWRRFLLRLFGARIAATAFIYPTARIWAPWHLTMHDHACLGHAVDCFCVAPVVIGTDAIVSVRSFLCTASHDIRQHGRPLTTAAIHVGRGGFVFAEAFVGMGVTIGEGAVVAARAVVVRDVAPFAIVAGNPARQVGERVIEEGEHAPP